MCVQGALWAPWVDDLSQNMLDLMGMNGFLFSFLDQCVYWVDRSDGSVRDVGNKWFRTEPLDCSLPFASVTSLVTSDTGDCFDKYRSCTSDLRSGIGGSSGRWCSDDDALAHAQSSSSSTCSGIYPSRPFSSFIISSWQKVTIWTQSWSHFWSLTLLLKHFCSCQTQK